MCHGKNISIGKTKNGLTMAICRPMYQILGFQPHNDRKIKANVFLSTMPPKCQKSYNVNYLVFHIGILQLWFLTWASQVSQPHFEGVVRSPLTLPKMGLGNPPGLPKTQRAIEEVKTSCLEVFFIPLERS